MKIKFRLILVLFLVSPLTFAFALNSNGQDAPIDDRRQPQEQKILEWQGSYGGFKEPTVMVIKNQNTWQGIYRMISGGNVILNLDFSRYMVVAVFMGEKMTGGYGVNILSAEEMDGMEVMEYKDRRKIESLTQIKEKIFVVEYEEVSPGPESFVTMAITTPYHIKVVRRSDLPVVFVRYEKVRD